MIKNLSYSEAFAKLEQLVEEIEDDNIQIDTLAEKVKQATELIVYCQTKLRVIGDDIKKEIGT